MMLHDPSLIWGDINRGAKSRKFACPRPIVDMRPYQRCVQRHAGLKLHDPSLIWGDINDGILRGHADRLAIMTTSAAPTSHGPEQSEGWNPLPWQYRGDCVRDSAINCLKNFPPNPNWPPIPDGDSLLQSLMEKAFGPVTLLVTCPFTPIMTLLQQSPE